MTKNSESTGEEVRFSNQPAAKGITPEALSQFQETILSYYREHGRDLPWRHTTDPYRILVSEIMLQQTQVDRVIRKYPEFLAAFPTCTDLAEAPLPKVLAIWQGMGYNRRAIALRASARKIVDDYGGKLPADADTLATFPGIGMATASSICAFSFNMPVVFIETNIRRVFIHFFFTGRFHVTDREIFPLVERSLDRNNPRVWYSALMDYGTLLKTAVRNPNRRSAHYTKQSRFEGSDREIRGLVLRILLQDPGLKEEDLIRDTGEEPDRVRRIIRDLLDEGFLERSASGVLIREE